MSNLILHTDKAGRLYWIDEGHSQTNEKFAVCRLVENGKLMHTAVMTRAELTFFMLTDNPNGIINTERLNAEDDTNKPKA